MYSTQSTTPSRRQIDSTAARLEGRTPSALSSGDVIYADLLLQSPPSSAPSTPTQDCDNEFDEAQRSSPSTPSRKIRPREPIDPSLCDGFGDLVRGTAIVARKIKHSDRFQKVRGKFRGKGGNFAAKRTASSKQQPGFDSSGSVFV